MYKIPKFRLPLNGMPYLTFIVLIYIISATMILPVLPIYIKSFGLSNASVGYVTSFIAILLLVYTILIRKMIKKVKKLNLIRIGFLGLSITILMLTILTNIKQFLILELFRTFFLVSIYITIGLFVREYTTIKKIGKTEGLYFSVYNVGYLIGPLFGGLIAFAYSFNTVFWIMAAMQFLLSLLLFIIPLKEKQVQHKHEFKFLDYFKNKELRKLYITTFGMVAWWTMLYTYMPLFANTNGFTEKTIGYALFAPMIALIILEVPIGKLADIHGFRKYISFGFFIMAAVLAFSYFANPIYTIVIIVIATIGAAFIEPLIEAYFFEEVRTKEKQNSLYPVYKTSSETSHLIVPLLYSTILIYFDFKIMFLFVSLFMLFFALISLRLKR